MGGRAGNFLFFYNILYSYYYGVTTTAAYIVHFTIGVLRCKFFLGFTFNPDSDLILVLRGSRAPWWQISNSVNPLKGSERSGEAAFHNIFD